ncbi:hypothetical protein AVL61_16225 [Kocuria rosea subsp. polaris]|uniref:Uncharacterized protein n=1 Tax=Kocuria rosea subsp. polaris TaxID=136273 RepID=A0A0W8IQD9_KOCRO|nr:hypothetical protein [Kocuria polaris]KUG62289.1 hypothetical protein AVL61_16225 [Kocuria polaris]
MRRALHVHRLSTYLVFQALTPVLALGYAAVLSPGSGWSAWLLCWAVLMGVGLVWTQLVWGPCWAAGADYGLSAGVRITLMAVAGVGLMLPFLVLHVVLDPVWFLYALVLTPYGLVGGLLGGAVLAVRDRGAVAGPRAHGAAEANFR